MDDSIKHFLDESLPHSQLVAISDDQVTDFKNSVVQSLRAEASKIVQAIRPSGEDVEMDGAEPNNDVAENDVQVEMSTMMEGFRYLKNDNTVYPVLKGTKLSQDFPIIPVGMLKIWREQDDEGDLDALLN